MKLIIGLGNPGTVYVNTRHNAGFLVADKLLKIKLPKGFVVRKSDVFMNESGLFVNKLTTDYGLPTIDLYVIHDDLDIPLGSFKIQFGRGPKDHNGLKSVDEALGTDQYWHVRIGIENRPERTGESSYAKASEGKEYVLQNFSDEERVILDRVIKKLLIDLIALISK